VLQIIPRLCARVRAAAFKKAEKKKRKKGEKRAESYF